MNALATLARTWPMLCALGAGLVLVALAAGAGGIAGVVLAGAGVVGLGWGVLSLRAARAVAPATALGVSAAMLTGSGALVGTGLVRSADVAVGPLLAASVFILVVAAHTALLVRHHGRATRPTRDAGTDAVPLPVPVPRAAAVDGRTSLVGLVVGALLVAGLATPALAATDAGELAVPHGGHSEHGDTRHH